MQMSPQRRRKLHGVPPSVRGQFDHELRAPSAALPVQSFGALEFLDDGTLVRRRDSETVAGGYDEIQRDADGEVTRHLLGGAPHNTDGAAVTGFEGDQQWRSYWLFGREVSQVTHWRQMSPDPAEFDAVFTEGWESAVEAFHRATGSSFGDAAGALEDMLELPPTDEDMRQGPEEATFLLGRREAALRLRRELLVAMFDGTEVRDLTHELDELLQEAAEG
ncbi:hypothetical protein AA0Z99_00135 [Agrococcus sp. 1P02AA]|uniref:hypothetical protein n=1 Tax=Agrococcus sp. 1P02AA TaxID=3132259 RepID=UPI0039A703C4